ncbi:LysM peptidoglycan-binding domain-containing protein [Candidatus Omnitrophota bacterium]
MSRRTLHCIVILFVALMFSGCFVRTYTVRKERVDQEVSGNRGYIQGSAPAMEEVTPRKKKRTTFVVEVETESHVQPEERVGTSRDAGVQTYEEVDALEYEEEPAGVVFEEGYMDMDESPEEDVVSEQTFVEYKVEEGDTLQKISKKFYDTYRKWQQIYDANTDTLKDPNRIKPGMIIRVPEE